MIKRYGAREIFDDTGALPTGNWLIRLCNEMIDRKINEQIIFDCNFRFDYFTEKNVHLMKKSGFRKLILGIESASERTIDILDKKLTKEELSEMRKDVATKNLKDVQGLVDRITEPMNKKEIQALAEKHGHGSAYLVKKQWSEIESRLVKTDGRRFQKP